MDWQLVENEAHREKFNFGVLGGLTTRWLDLLAQFRLTHYGGQLFTKSDPLRDGQLDPVRQPESAAGTSRGRLVRRPAALVAPSIDGIDFFDFSFFRFGKRVNHFFVWCEIAFSPIGDTTNSKFCVMDANASQESMCESPHAIGECLSFLALPPM